MPFEPEIIISRYIPGLICPTQEALRADLESDGRCGPASDRRRVEGSFLGRPTWVVKYIPLHTPTALFFSIVSSNWARTELIFPRRSELIAV